MERAFSLLGYLPYRCHKCKHRFFFHPGKPGPMLLRLGMALLVLILAAVVIWNLSAHQGPAPVAPQTQAANEAAQLTQEVQRLREEVRLLRAQLGQPPMAPNPSPLRGMAAAPSPAPAPLSGVATSPTPAPLPGAAPSIAPAPLPKAAPPPVPSPAPLPSYIRPTPDPGLGRHALLGQDVALLRQEMTRLEIQAGKEIGEAALLWRELVKQGKAPKPAQGLASPFTPNSGLASSRPSLAGLSPQAAAASLRQRIALLEHQIREQRAKNQVMRSVLY
ncbi:MAG: hypothetical protein KQH53_11560 [Desulfarculaceae bacterium]|nr:hypothetical protein [Desulfarculaceae bacterium]